MANELWSDILHQPANLRHVINHLYGAERTNIETAAAFLRNERPIVMIGVASAAYLCFPAEFYLGEHRRPARILYASDALYNQLPVLEASNVVINSRSGETAEIVRLGRALVEKGTPFLAVTNEPQSTLARMATHIIWCNTHKDELVSINVVTGMMTAMLVLAGALVGKMDELRPDLERLAGAMGEVISRASQAMDAFQQFFEARRPIYLLYRGFSRGSAYCGRLVLEEVARTPAVPLEAAEFRQGPNEVIDERFASILFVPDGRQGELNRSLARDIWSNGGRVMLVGETLGAESHPHALLFPIPATPNYLRPVLEVVPVQLLAYRLAESQGYRPGEVRYISKVILAEEGIPNQERHPPE